MNIHSIHRRLDRLRVDAPSETRRMILMHRADDEPFELAVERWCRQNPAEPPPDDRTDIVILRAVAPMRNPA